ncbi:carbamoyltransferase C-terminal domain-containing protein [Marinibaculum pumilum]|uniref:Carbamoyltransferase C-terminal domain-containing protein n=1 Tax=Marinibaculum pumilum TaxID=1766165 RepID=A0ABV7KZM8_9PROT
MNILALNFGHDAAVAVLDERQIRNCLMRERSTRVKHHMGLSIDLIDRALEDAGLTVADIDYCAIVSSQWIEVILPAEIPLDIRFTLHPGHPESHDPATAAQYGARAQAAQSIDPVIRSLLAAQDARSKAFITTIFPEGRDYDATAWRHIPLPDTYIFPEDWKRCRTLAEIARQRIDLAALQPRLRQFDLPVTVTLHGREIPGYCVHHHLAHAASSFHQSGFEEAGILSNDGAGATDYLSGLFLYGSGGRIYPLFPHYNTVGSIYLLISRHLKLGGWDASGKLMGLASYGEPAFFRPDFVGNRYDRGLDSSEGYEEWLSHCERQAHAQGYDVGPLARPAVATAPINADIAASSQKLLEQTLLSSARCLHRLLENSGLPATQICHTGGTALSCPANTLIAHASGFDRLFVDPGCNDSGLAIGAGLFLRHQILDLPPGRIATTPYLGPCRQAAEVDRAYDTFRGDLVEIAVEDAATDAADRLARNEVVAWFEGRSEIGPRALGHRSILADPRHGANLLRVNAIKGRESWRPFAPAVLAEEAANWFAGAPLPSPYMLLTAEVLRPDLVPAITHVDGTARLQTVDASCGAFHELLQAFFRLTGVPIVINTSFNGPGEPIVETPAQAMAFLASTELDCLYVDGRSFMRRSGAETRREAS